MSSSSKTSIGLNKWAASDKPVREDFVKDNEIISDSITQLNSDLTGTKSSLSTLTAKAVTFTERSDKKAHEMESESNRTDFFVISGTWGTTDNGFPVSSPGVLQVMNLYNTHVIQIYYPVGVSAIYKRRKVSGTGWGAWETV